MWEDSVSASEKEAILNQLKWWGSLTEDQNLSTSSVCLQYAAVETASKILYSKAFFQAW